MQIMPGANIIIAFFVIFAISILNFLLLNKENFVSIFLSFFISWSYFFFS